VRHRIGAVAYELCLPTTSRVHPVFHVSLLRAFKGTHVATDINSLSHADRDSPNSLNNPTPNLKSISNVQPLHSPDFETPSEEQLMPPPNSAPCDSTLSNQHLIAPPNPAELLNPPLSDSPNSLPQPPIPTTHTRPRNDHILDSQNQDFTPNNAITFQNNPQMGQSNVHPSHPTHPQAQSDNDSSAQINPTTHFEDKVLEPADGTDTTGPNNNRPKRQIVKPKWMKDYIM